MLRSREPGHVMGGIGQRLDTNCCRWQQCKKYTVCVQRPLDERTGSSIRWRCANCRGVFCTGLTSGGYLASPWPSEAPYPKYLVSLEDGLEPPEGQEERLPKPQRITLGESSETGLSFLGPFSPPLLFFSSMRVMIFVQVLGSSKSCNKLDASDRCIGYPCFASSLYRLSCVSSSLRSV